MAGLSCVLGSCWKFGCSAAELVTKVRLLTLFSSDYWLLAEETPDGAQCLPAAEIKIRTLAACIAESDGISDAETPDAGYCSSLPAFLRPRRIRAAPQSEATVSTAQSAGSQLRLGTNS